MSSLPIEEQLSEKKRQGGGGGGSQFEGEPKRQKVAVEEEAYDRDFDDDNGDDFTSEYQTIDTGFVHDEADVYVDDKDGRKCDQVPICEKYLHKCDFFFGSPVFELYKVKLILNKERYRFLSGKLCGVIKTITSCKNSDSICYYKVTKEDAIPITLDPDNNIIDLTLSGPKTNPPIARHHSLEVDFAFKFENSDGTIIDVFEQYDYLEEDADAEVFDDGHGNHTANYSIMLFMPGSIVSEPEYCCQIQRKLLRSFDNSDAIKVAAYYGTYDAAWASVDVTILKEGVSRFYGFIYARSCVLYSRIRMLSLQSNQMRELQASNKSVELTRPVVAVPSFSSLIIAALPFDQDGNRTVRGKTFFPALKEGSDFKFIGDGCVRIGVKWARRTSCC